MKNRSSIHLVPQDAPALAVVSGARPSNRTPVALASHLLAASLFSDAVEGQQATVADAIGVAPQVVSRYARGGQLLPFGDVLACPPAIASELLHRGLEHVEAQPWRGETTEVLEAIRICGGAAEVAARLGACPVEAMSTGDRRTLAAWCRELAGKLLRLAARLERGGR